MLVRHNGPWLAIQRIARLLPFLLLPAAGVSFLTLTGCSPGYSTTQSPPMVVEYDSLPSSSSQTNVPESVQIVESRWGTHRSGDFLQLHVVLEEGSQFVPVQINLLSQTEAGKVLKQFPLQINADFACRNGALSGLVAGAESYDTEPLLTRRPIYQPFRKLQLPRGTNLESFDVLFRDQHGTEILITGIPVSGQCLSLFE